MKRRFLQVAAIALVVWSGARMSQAAYIHTKASLAQVLIRRAWMKNRKGGIEKPWPWADTTPVARLIDSAREVDLVVLSGSSGRTLAFGPGHIDGTAKPGARGNVGISGHRDTHFRFLRDVAIGEKIVLEDVDLGRTEYRVTGASIVDRNDAAILRDSGDDRITLVTCYPFDAITPGGPLRYVVTAIAVSRTG